MDTFICDRCGYIITNGRLDDHDEDCALGLRQEIKRLTEECNKWQLVAGKLYEDKVYMRAALRDIYEACMAADADGELDSRIDGDLLDAARQAIKQVEG